MNIERNERRGVVLLVVLGMLAFLGVLVVTYVVFTSRSRQSAFRIAHSEYRKPMHREILNDAMMKLLRGTDDTGDAFYGEDLLSDLYGRTGAIRIGGVDRDTLTALPPGSFGMEDPLDRGVLHIGDNFVKIPYAIPGVTFANLDGTDLALDDYLAGRIITFDEGPLKDHSFRVLRSTGARDVTPAEEYALRYSLFIELDPQLSVVLDDNIEVTIGELLSAGNYAVRTLFYHPNGVWGSTGNRNEAGYAGSDDVAYNIHINPAPLNGLGIGFDGENLNENHLDNGLPLAFQPKGISDKNSDGKSNKHSDYAVYGDFDEPYDAPDFQNLFLAHRITDGAGNVQGIIPSFHRPALLNYIVNQYDLSSITPAELRELILAIEAATLRPIPWAALNPAPPYPGRDPINPGFTGGNSEFALRSPNKIDDPTNDAHIARLNQLLMALIEGPWDVDNDGDGTADSVWVDLGLPLVTSPDGKLLRPMVAALIEDTGGRLNVNAHGTLAQGMSTYRSPIPAPWGGSAVNTPQNVFRGLGYGPGDIFLPADGEAHASATPFTVANRNAFLSGRYREASSPLPGVATAGDRGHDLLDRILTGTRPGIQTWASGVGFSDDPWGRGGVGISRSGRLHAAVSGTALALEDLAATPPQPHVNETYNDPYEADPSGELAGDSLFTVAELEAVMRNTDWDSEMLPNRLRDALANSLNSDPNLYRVLTTRSVSLDVPPAIRAIGDRTSGNRRPVALATVLRERMNLPYSNATEREAARLNFRALVGPELTLGQKLDVNRPFGNGIDDNGNGVIDEPREVANNGLDDDGDGSVDEADEVPVESLAFPAVSGTDVPASIQSTFGSVAPDYNFEQSTSGRQLLARNLYVLMMAFSGDSYAFPMRDSAKMDPGGKVAEFRARKLAQWAVNVVDYRDPDAIMTRFAYDPNPFGTTGWNPTKSVWGVESPELIFQESLALHDVRTKDTKLEGGGGGKLKEDDPGDAEKSTDSIRMPQGSLFLELYNPRARIDTGTTDARTQVSPVEAPPQELYTFDTSSNQYVLDLSKTAPAGSGGTAMPVWRIAITKPHYPDAPNHPARGSAPENNTPEDSDPAKMRGDFPDTTSFELAELEELGVNNVPGRLAIDRVVFFTPGLDASAIATALTDVNVPEQVFFNYLGAGGSTVGLLPEQYLVLAPRTVTHLGSIQYPVSAAVGPSPQNFTISPDADHVGVSHTNLAGDLTTLNTKTLTHQALPLVIAADPRRLATANGGTWSTMGAINTKLPEGVGLNVSEPLPGANYYPEPNFQLDSTKDAEFPLEDSYVDLTTPATGQVKDIPVDLDNDRPIVEWTRARTGNANPDEPLLGYQERFCTAFLQRLADPTLPYQNDPSLPNYNPYRSVDWMSIDLTVFSGEETESTFGWPNPREYANGSRQRNGQDAYGNGDNILYSNRTAPPATQQLTPSTHYFSIELTGAADPSTGNFSATPARQTLSHLNSGFGQPIGGPNRGQPQIPFALHEWMNRPFATPYELLMVPATSQGRLFEEFTTASGANPYVPGAPGPVPDNLAEFRAPFGHLLNFFQADANESDASQFSRIFDYIDTRPPFRGEVEVVDPTRLVGAGSGSALARARNQFVDVFQPPFNVFTDNRREGEINLNTIGEYSVWMGLMYGHLTSGEWGAAANSTGPFSFKRFRDNRRGYAPPGGVKSPVWNGTDAQSPPYNYAPDTLHPEYPTEFAGIYRPNAAAGLAPKVGAGDDHLRRIKSANTGYSSVDSGLLRRDDPANDALFVRSNAGDVWRNRDRNAFFRYQTLMRMPNLVTEQSHVYCVRLTLGYFEVASSDLSTGVEYKADHGQQERYQATFFIDRSIPVAYEPGADRNVRNTILYQRIAE